MKALIFDCDGTLADTMPAHYVAWTATLEQYGIPFPERMFYQLGGVPSNKIVHLLSEKSGVTVDVAAVVKEKEAAFLRALPQVRPVDAVVHVARQHRNVVPMAVASGGVRPVITRILDQLGIREWFQTIVTAEDTELHKPEPDVFLEAARRLQVAPADCVVYEDTDIGIEAARRAGMAWVDVRTLYTPAPAAAAGA